MSGLDGFTDTGVSTALPVIDSSFCSFWHKVPASLGPQPGTNNETVRYYLRKYSAKYLAQETGVSTPAARA